MDLLQHILIGFNTLIFLSLSFLHVYWAFGGAWGSTAVIPTASDDQPAFMPGMFMTLVVAFGLFLFAAITAGNFGLFSGWIPDEYIRFGMWAIVIIFFLRAMGDFNLVGFFKKTKGTKFAENDSKFYSPLCLYLSVSGIIILLFVPFFN